MSTTTYRFTLPDGTKFSASTQKALAFRVARHVHRATWHTLDHAERDRRIAAAWLAITLAPKEAAR